MKGFWDFALLCGISKADPNRLSIACSKRGSPSILFQVVPADVRWNWTIFLPFIAFTAQILKSALPVWYILKCLEACHFIALTAFWVSLPFFCKIHQPECNGKMKYFNNNNKRIAHIFIWATSGELSPWMYLTNYFYFHNLDLLSTSSVPETVLNTSHTLCLLIQTTEQRSRYYLILILHRDTRSKEAECIQSKKLSCVKQEMCLCVKLLFLWNIL